MAAKTEWVLTANAAECRVFEHDKKFSPLTEVRDLIRPANRVPARDINADRPGRSFDRAGQGRHAMEPRVDVHEEESARFARQIADTLAENQRAGAYDRLIVIAAPKLLGHLREALSEPVRRSVAAEIDKDLTGYDAAQLTEWLRKEFWEKG